MFPVVVVDAPNPENPIALWSVRYQRKGKNRSTYHVYSKERAEKLAEQIQVRGDIVVALALNCCAGFAM